MSLVGLKKFKIGLVLLVFFGLFFSLFCAFNHSETSLHSALPEIGTLFMLDGETCCGANVSQHHEILNGEYLTVSRDIYRNLFAFFITSLVVILMMFGRRFLDDVGRLLSVIGKLHMRDNPHIALYNHLKSVFSRGILHPKKYSVTFSR